VVSHEAKEENWWEWRNQLTQNELDIKTEVAVVVLSTLLWYIVLLETSAENFNSDTAVLDCAMCVNKVLQMQRVFLTENESQPTSTTSTAVLSEETECKDTAYLAASSSLTMDAASVVDSSGPQAAESDRVILPLQTVAADDMDLSQGENDDLMC